MEGLVVDPAFWSGKRVFVTGHTGFKGGWLAHWLKAMGAQVTGYALAPPTTPNLFTAARIADGMTHVIGDLRDGETLKARLIEARPQIVLHLAAQPLVRYSYETPEETFAVNVMGSLNLLEAVRASAGVTAVVGVTSDKCYENREWQWGYRENEPLGGYDPYSASKACTEILLACYRRSFLAERLSLASARAGNVIGGGDWGDERLVPDIMRGFSAGEAVVIRNPHAIRPWQHVLDALAGYLCLAQKLAGPEGPRFAEAWNFGPGSESEITVGELACRLQGLWGPGTRLELAEHKSGPHEANFLKLDSAKARGQLGWSPRWDLGQALQATVDWYRAHAAGAGELGTLMSEQIAGHQAAPLPAETGVKAIAG
jgi:CDP-glucose 4,6-dehydratase